MAYRLPNDIQKMFVEQGLVPPECKELALAFPAAGVVTLRYDVFATMDQIEKIAAILTVFVEKEKSLV